MRGLLIGLAVAALAVAGCGGGDDDEASRSITTTVSEFEFDPDTWRVPAGVEVSITVDNRGTVDHEWVVIERGQDIDAEADFEEDKVLFEVEAVPAGESKTESFTVEAPGTYQVICALPGHFDAGMEGTLTVERGAT